MTSNGFVLGRITCMLTVNASAVVRLDYRLLRTLLITSFRTREIGRCSDHLTIGRQLATGTTTP